MQVKDLIEQLQGMNPEAEVHYAYNYGDHWRTEVAPKVSEYHRMDKMVDSEDCYNEETGDYREDVRKVVVLG